MERKWALILGSSSGFGASTARIFAEKGYGIIGIHLDRRNRITEVESLVRDLRNHDVPVHFFNVNAASDAKRNEVIPLLEEILVNEGGKIHFFLHSLAFGSLLPFISEQEKIAGRKHLDMTIDVMANSLVYWTQSLLNADVLRNARIFAMTSNGSGNVWPNYGPVSAAKAALEAHVRQLAIELAPYGFTVNAILAGVTDTPALRKIPGHEHLLHVARKKNPHNRTTQPKDVAKCLAALASDNTYWMTGNVICVDGGESICA